jgi:hypothetical protein
MLHLVRLSVDDYFRIWFAFLMAALLSQVHETVRVRALIACLALVVLHLNALTVSHQKTQPISSQSGVLFAEYLRTFFVRFFFLAIAFLTLALS